jgi:hypothetical protein
MLYFLMLKARAEALSRSTSRSANLEKPNPKHPKHPKHGHASGLDSDGRVNGGVRV